MRVRARIKDLGPASDWAALREAHRKTAGTLCEKNYGQTTGRLGKTTGLPLLDGARALLRCTASKQHTGHVAKRFLLESCGGRFPSQPSFLQPQSAQPIQGQGRLYLRVGSSGFRAAGVVPRVGNDLQHVRTFSSRDLHTDDSPPSTPSREYAKVHHLPGPETARVSFCGCLFREKKGRPRASAVPAEINLSI